MFNFVRYQPSSDLAAYVQGYWILEKMDVPSVHSALHLVPDGFPEIIFNLDAPFRLFNTENEIAAPEIGLIGQLSKGAKMEADKGAKALFVKLYPWAVFSLFQVPFHLLNNEKIALQNIISPLIINRLYNEVLEAKTLKERLQYVETFLRNQLTMGEEINPIVSLAVQQIFQSGGTISTDELAGKIKISQRYLEVLFKREIGLSPMRYARLIRTKKIANQLMSATPNSLGQLAENWGFFDQSHFTKSFKQVVGKRPTDFISYAQNFPLIQREAYRMQWDYSE